MIPAPVFLLGMPRSGTTWLSQLVEAHPRFVVRLSPIYSYELKGALDEHSTEDEWRRVLERARSTSDRFMTQDWQRDRGNLPPREADAGVRLAVKDTRFHDVYLAGMERLSDARCVVIVRNPLAMLHSWLRSPEFPPNADFAAQWRAGTVRKREGPGEFWGFDDWMRLTRTYMSKAEEQPDRFLLVRFESLVTDTVSELTRLFGHVGEELHPHVLEFARESHSRHVSDPYAVFKDPEQVLSEWRAGLDASIVHAVREELDGTDLEEYVQ